MADWNTRLAVSYDDGSGHKVEISPIDSFTPTFSLNAEVLHSIERDPHRASSTRRRRCRSR